jgi:hypothetical protein
MHVIFIIRLILSLVDRRHLLDDLLDFVQNIFLLLVLEYAHLVKGERMGCACLLDFGL